MAGAKVTMSPILNRSAVAIRSVEFKLLIIYSDRVAMLSGKQSSRLIALTKEKKLD